MVVNHKDWLARKRVTLVDFIKAEARGATNWHQAAGNAAAAFNLLGVNVADPQELVVAARKAFPVPVEVPVEVPVFVKRRKRNTAVTNVLKA